MEQTIVALSVLTCLSVAAVEGLSLGYRMQEETGADASLGDVIRDAGLSLRYNSSVIGEMRLAILRGPYAKYFAIAPDRRTLRTSDVRLDRDVVCPKRASCVVRLDVVISKPIALFEVIQISVTVDDLNDNAPTFADPEVTVYLSESARPGVPTLLPLATDNDSGSSGNISYSLSPGSDSFSLVAVPDVLGSKELKLVLSRSLDRETRPDYELNVVARDGGQPPLSSTLRVTVVVTDTNDNYPVFDKPLYNASVPEDYPLSKPIVTVHATDPDSGDNGVVVYRFSGPTSGTYGSVFGLDPDTGDLYLVSGLDHEMRSSYYLVVEAADKGPDCIPATTRILLRVTDTNDVTPRLTVNVLTSSGRAEVTENQPPGEFLAHLSVADEDQGENGDVMCEIVNSDRFQIVPLSDKEFKLITNDSFDRETEETVTVSVTCTDRGRPPLSSTENIQVSVLDQNDNAPRFLQHNYTTSVRENNSYPSPIFYVSATDSDTGSNANLTYHLAPSSEGYLRVDARSGLVSSNSRLDREATPEFTVVIYAVDGGEPALTGSARIKVLVDDVNDEAPYFEQDPYVFGTFENQPIGTAIGQVAALDRDTGPRAEVVYTLTPDSQGRSTFKVDPKSGRISTKRVLDREETDKYVLTVMATNTMYPYFSATTTLTIHVADKNDQAPVITFPSKVNNTVQISALAIKGTSVTRIQAYDNDLGKNSLLVYQFAKGNEDNVFTVNPASGEVMLQQSLDGEEKVYSFLVVVQDQGTPKKTAVADLLVVANATIGAPPGVDGSAKIRDADDGKPKELSMEVTIVIIVGCLSVVLAACLAALLAFLCRRYRQTEPPKRADVGKNATDTMKYSDVRHDADEGVDEPTSTPLTSVTIAESLEQRSPADPGDRIYLWISDAYKKDEIPHLDSGHGSWAESGSDCGNVALDCGTTGPRGYFRRPVYPEGYEQQASRSPDEHYVHAGSWPAGSQPSYARPGTLSSFGEPAMTPRREQNLQTRAGRLPPPKPVAPPPRTFFLRGPPTLPESYSLPRQKPAHCVDEMTNASQDNLNVVRNQLSDPDAALQDSRLVTGNTRSSGSPQSSFSSGRSQELKPLAACQPEIADGTSRDHDEAGDSSEQHLISKYPETAPDSRNTGCVRVCELTDEEGNVCVTGTDHSQ